MVDVRFKKTRARDGYEKPWTFITNHAVVLSLLVKHPRITAREVAEEAGITERNVRIIISDLEKDGYIGKIREGRNVRYQMDMKRSLRHKMHRDVAVSDLIEILKGKRSNVEKNIV
ncbi:MAG: winged helix-turn-helix domain-containing protein [Syntrophales bacterium]|nr:winged helix-turn-helix domain-containing protein [Syntrophales bacterium]